MAILAGLRTKVELRTKVDSQIESQEQLN